MRHAERGSIDCACDRRFSYPSVVRLLSPALAVSVAVVLDLAAPRSTACAYERARVEGAPELGVYWTSRALELRLTAAIGDLAEPDLRAAVDRSLTTWTGAGGCTDVSLALGTTSAATTTNLDGGRHDGENRIVVRRAWPPLIPAETIALTTYAYRPATGELLDADIDVNAQAHVFSASVAPPPSDVIDVENTITHELGHVLGFAHVLDPEATMYVGSRAGETLKRDLSPDDVSAICDTYPVGAVTPPAPPPRTSSPTCGCAAWRSHTTMAMPEAFASLLTAVVLSARAASRSCRRAPRDGTASGTTGCRAADRASSRARSPWLRRAPHSAARSPRAHARARQ